jgi:hypothetical protein
MVLLLQPRDRLQQGHTALADPLRARGRIVLHAVDQVRHGHEFERVRVGLEQVAIAHRWVDSSVPCVGGQDHRHAVMHLSRDASLVRSLLSGRSLRRERGPRAMTHFDLGVRELAGCAIGLALLFTRTVEAQTATQTPAAEQPPGNGVVECDDPDSPQRRVNPYIPCVRSDCPVPPPARRGC